MMVGDWDVEYFVAIRHGLSKLLLFDNGSSSTTSSNHQNTTRVRSSHDFLDDLTEDRIWYSPENQQVWVADNTLSDWYANQSEAGQRMKRQRQLEKRIRGGSSTDPQKKFEEFWTGFVKRWLHAIQLTEDDVDMQMISPFQQQLCFRNRDNSNNNHQGSCAFSDAAVSSPASEKGRTMVEDGN